MVVATSLLGFITKVFSAFSRIERPHIAWTSVSLAIFALLTCAYVSPSPASATAGINRQINFQGRLLNSNGATVPDGFYNIQFKIYQDGDGQSVGNTTGSPAGTLMWTESHLNDNSQGVTVKNGFLSVQLGSINAFANQIDWNQDTIWLSMNIGNTDVSCTPFSNCLPDGEMVPMKRMTATPYALNSGLLNGLTSSNFVQLAQGVQTDASAGPSSIFINKTNTGNLLQLQSSGADAFTISNAGDLTFGSAVDHTISIATAAASTAGKTLTLVAGEGGSGTGSAGGDLVIQGGAAGGTDGNGGNITINAGAKTGTGNDGTLSLGTANTSAITLGQNTTLTTGKSLTINGDAFTDLTGSGLTIDTGALTVDASSATGFFRNGGNSFGGSAVLGTNDANTLAVRTNSVNRATFDTAGTLYLGDSITAASTGTFTLQGSTGAAANAGYSLSLLGGTGGSNSNGGDITLQGGAGTGTGVQGQVKLSAGGYTTTTIGAYGSNTTISQAAVDNYSSIAISASTGGLTISVPAPTTKYDGRVLYIQLTGSNSITLSPSGGSSTSMTTNSVYALVWNTTLNGWLAAGTDSNGFIQNQNSVDQVANFRINGSGQLGGSLTATTSVLTAKLDAASAGALNIGDPTTPTATIINLNQDTTLAAGKSLTITGGNTGSRPTCSSTDGKLYYDQDTDQLLVCANNKWQAEGREAVLVAANDSSPSAKAAADYVVDGTADQAEINSALTEATTFTGNNHGSRKVYLFAGTYNTDDAISIPNDTTLSGSGSGSVIKFANIIGQSKNMIINSDTSTGTGVTIRDLKLDGNSGVNGTGVHRGIYFTGMGGGSVRQGALVTDIIVTKFRASNITLSGSSHNTISNIVSDSSGNGTGLVLTSSSSNNMIIGNKFQENEFSGFEADSSSDHNTITGNTVLGNYGPGIKISSSNNTVSGNKASSNATDGFLIEASATDNSVTGNAAYGNVSSGFRINGTNNTLTGDAADGGLYGFYVNADYNTLTGNTANNNTSYGIWLSSANSNIISSNKINNPGGATLDNGIFLQTADNNSIIGNIVNDGSGTTNCSTSCYAINISNSGSDATYLADNQLGNGTLNDIGTGTIYGGQGNGTTYKIQPADDFTITGNAASTISTTAGDLTVQGGSGTVTLGTSTNLTASGALTIASAASTALTLTSNAAATWGTTSGNLTLDAGATLNLGTVSATGLSLSKTGSTTTVNGHLTIATGQNLTVNGDVITDLTGSGLTLSGSSLTVDSSSATGFYRNGGNSFGTSATLGTNDSNELALRTNGTTRATFASGSNTLYMGNGDATGLAASPNSFTIQATSNSSTGAGGALTIQAGGSGASANGANLTLNSGTGGNSINGQVIISTPTFQAYGGALQKCTGAAATMALSQPSIDNFGTVSTASDSTANCVISVPNPSITTAGRVLYITADNTSTSSFVLSINGGGAGNLVAMRANSSATLVWNGAKWAPAGASSSTTLQAAYDNTIQSSGGAELIISKTASTNGLTIRDDLTNSVNGALVNIQSKTAANLFSVNSNLTDYASNPGAETQGASASTFSSNTWGTQGAGGVVVARNTTTNDNSIATGQASVSVTTGATANSGVKNQIVNSAGSPVALTANNHYNVSFSVRLPSNATTTFTDLRVDYSMDGGTGASLTACTSSQTVAINLWSKVNCSFTAPASGITTGNTIMIRQLGATARTFFIDNLSVTIAADYNLTTDGGVDDAGNFTSNWDKATFGGAPGGSIAQDAVDGQAASTSAKYTSVPSTAKVGIRNKLAINPLPSTLYRVTAYAKSSNAFSDFMIRYTATSAAANTSNDANYVNCQDYNTRTISTSAWTKVTCYIKTSATVPDASYLYFVQESATARNISVDSISMTLSEATTPNVQVGGGTNGGPTTLFTLDRGASAPIAGDNDALLGSMYYDTSLGKLQCYEADGWGACGSSPDNIITISPEYTNAVMHGTGVGTMISDLCSDFLNINDGSSSQPTICSTNETYNFYNWTSPQASSQTYSIYVTYQLPSTFKSFTSASTSLQGRVSNTSNASINYGIYKNTGSSMVQCGTNVSVASGAANAWETKVATGAADPSACGFAAGNSIVFKISMSANSNANAYIGNIGFTFSNN